jgi:hypothetical protein
MDHMNPSLYKSFVLGKIDHTKAGLTYAVKPDHTIEEIMFQAGAANALDILKAELLK